MSKPVEVTREVAGLLNRNLVEDHPLEVNLADVIHAICEESDIVEFFELNGLTAQKLLDAINYGYVVPYQFKVGDVVSDENFRSVSVVTKHTVDIYNANKHSLKLICKAENREDVKQ